MPEYLPPDDEAIADLFESIQPRPGTEFHNTMARQPWNAARRPPEGVVLHLQRLAALAALVFLFVLILSIASPTLEVVAQRLMHFFQPGISDQTTFQIPLEDINNPEARFSLTVAEAELLAGFEAHLPGQLPQGFAFSGAAFDTDREAIVINYHAEQSGAVLRVFQSQAGEEYQQIGASAGVESVLVGDAIGEYVSGAWSVPAVKSTLEADTAESTLPLEATWNPDAEIQFLRWKANDRQYEILYAGNGSEKLTQADLIALAESMKK